MPWVGFSCVPYGLIFLNGIPAPKRQRTSNKQAFFSGHHPRPSIRWCDWKGSPVSFVGPRPSPLMVSRGPVFASPRTSSATLPHLSLGNCTSMTTNGKGLSLWVRRKKSSLLFFILFYFILFYFILFYFILFYFILFYFILFYFILFYFILFYFILFYFILFYFILFYFILFYFIVDVWPYFRPFKENFARQRYESAYPPFREFPNSPSCDRFKDFVHATIQERVRTGSLIFWGIVGEVQPPNLVMPITMNAFNLWIRDLPFTLDYLSDLPRYVARGHFQTVCDDKSGYDHLMLTHLAGLCLICVGTVAVSSTPHYRLAERRARICMCTI